MKQVIYVSLAVILYALGNVMIEQRLKPFTQFGIMAFSYVPMLVMTFGALAVLRVQARQISFPTGDALYVAGIIGIVFFVADTFFFSAYNNNADAFTVSSIVLMFPAATSLMKFFWDGSLPNRYHVTAYAVAVVAVVLAEKGNEIQNAITR
jgi:drug/metabolite transporter (DMT)-like permease